MKQRTGITRREALRLLGRSAAAATAFGLVRPRNASAAPRLGSNDKIRIAMIGCGGMGFRHLEALAVNPRCDIVAVCDCFKPRHEAGAGVVMQHYNGRAPDQYADFRKVLDRKDVDAVFTPTPDNWHPLITIKSCEAGKDVYVEKPACMTIAEGRAMVNAARRYGRVVQLGTQQRSMPVFQKAIEIVRSGKLGQICNASAWIGANVWGSGETPAPIPAGLDWDMWLGPAPYVPYSRERHFGWMGWHDYARGGQLTNWGVHLLDIVHWGIGEDRPLSVQAVGGSYRGGAGSENYDTIETVFEFRNCTVTWEQRYSNLHNQRGYGVKFQGTDGTLYVDRSTFSVEPESLGIQSFAGEPERTWANKDHHNNFFDCVMSRKRPAADIEQGVRSTSTVLLAGIALKVKRKLYWDGETETFRHDEQANRHLSRTYRAPWHL